MICHLKSRLNNTLKKKTKKWTRKIHWHNSNNLPSVALFCFPHIALPYQKQISRWLRGRQQAWKQGKSTTKISLWCCNIIFVSWLMRNHPIYIYIYISEKLLCCYYYYYSRFTRLNFIDQYVSKYSVLSLFPPPPPHPFKSHVANLINSLLVVICVRQFDRKIQRRNIIFSGRGKKMQINYSPGELYFSHSVSLK